MKFELLWFQLSLLEWTSPIPFSAQNNTIQCSILQHFSALSKLTMNFEPPAMTFNDSGKRPTPLFFSGICPRNVCRSPHCCPQMEKWKLSQRHSLRWRPEGGSSPEHWCHLLLPDHCYLWHTLEWKISGQWQRNDDKWHQESGPPRSRTGDVTS